MKTIVKIVILLVVLAAAALGLWTYFSPEASHVTMTPAKIDDVKEMMRLSSLQLYEEVPVKGSVGPRHLVARLALEGSVEFDLDKLKFEENGDTVKVVLPPEIVTLNESTRPGSYVVFDTWNDRIFGSGNITAAEENRMKALTVANAKKLVYSKGYVKQARADALTSLKSLLMATFPGKAIIVIDPTPAGTRP